MARLTRTAFLKLSGSLGLGAAVAGCDLLSTEPTGSGDSDAPAGAANGPEAPSLGELVKSGDLPPVEERLPESPRTIEVADRIGTYGGTWNTALLGIADSAWLGRTVGYDRLVHWDPDWQEIVPNVAESFEVISDGAAYSFTLRRGLKWSDGRELTADDILFWYDAIFKNAELTPAPAEYLAAGGVPVVVEKVGDHEVRFVFDRPNGLFLQWLATYDTSFDLVPRHYLEEFHPDYNDNVDQLVAAAGLPDWVELFSQRRDYWNNTELPRLHGWLPKNTPSEGGQVVFERNPYYFKVDAEGSQLPYIDSIVYDLFEDEETMVLRAASGDLDMHARHINIPRNKPVLAKSRESGDYALVDMKTSAMNTMIIYLNLCHPDPVYRAAIQNKDFRVGLSHAINRQEIIDTVYQRQGEPWQAAPRPEAPFFDEESAKQYTEHDLDLAAEHLDRSGLTLGADGKRHFPDGRPATLSVLAQTRYFEMADALDLIRVSWAEVGIELTVHNVDGTLYDERVDANEFDCVVDTGEIGYVDAVVDPRQFFPSYLSGASMAPLWYRWYAGLEPSEEPPEPMQRQMSLYRDELLATSDQQRHFEIMTEIVAIAREEFWTMGISLPANPYAIVKNSFHNVPNDMWEAFRYPTPGPTNICQYFIEES